MIYESAKLIKYYLSTYLPKYKKSFISDAWFAFYSVAKLKVR